MAKEVRIIVSNVDDPIEEDRIAYMIHTLMKANKISTDVAVEKVGESEEKVTAERTILNRIAKRETKSKES